MLETSVVAQSAAAPAGSTEPLDFDAIYRIKDEALNRSQVMETLSYLTDVHGPRLTNSPNMRAAADWTKKRLESYGLANVALEAWGPFGRGWVNERMMASMTAPQSFPLLAFPKA
ncbi:MAG: peptidase M28, partial [Vicinamibacteraceae bacterium]